MGSDSNIKKKQSLIHKALNVRKIKEFNNKTYILNRKIMHMNIYIQNSASTTYIIKTYQICKKTLKHTNTRKY